MLQRIGSPPDANCREFVAGIELPKDGNAGRKDNSVAAQFAANVCPACMTIAALQTWIEPAAGLGRVLDIGVGRADRRLVEQPCLNGCI